ncbi:MAG: Bro-N domain-containing protein, partial [Chitinispirillales bacterium]|nr:Bro-N domain-containing protein [Chitinispirillales bacterium]
MDKKNEIQLFEARQVRSVWDEEAEKMWFSVVDVVAALTESDNPRRYWSDLKRKLAAEGSQLYENIVQLKMLSSDGKYYQTDVADTEQILRIIQSIPSKKAEPFKLWLAQVGRERIDEAADPELSIDRAILAYRRLGYS